MLDVRSSHMCFYIDVRFYHMIIFMRGGAVAARWAHNPKVAGSNPVPAIGNMLMAVFIMYKPAHPKRVVSSLCL